MPMYRLGTGLRPAPRARAAVHGDSPLASCLVKEGRVEARAYKQTEAFAAAMTFRRGREGIAAPS